MLFEMCQDQLYKGGVGMSAHFTGRQNIAINLGHKLGP